jgi:selenocysteine lyase/cysteine desulfurase
LRWSSTLRSHSPHAEQLARWRADTPGAAGRIHLNNAGAALSPRPVQAAVLEHLEAEAMLGGYEAADAARDRAAAAYSAVARLLNTEPSRIAMAQSSTVAFAEALSAFDFGAGDTIVTSRADYASNQIMYLSLARRRGVEIVRADDLAEGGVDPDSVRKLVAHRRPALVALTWVPTNSGLVQDVEAVGAVCREADVPYLVDACQAVGQMPVDVARIGCDYLAATARKFLRGPRGMGFLYVAERATRRGDFPLLVDMRGATWTAADAFELADGARRFETWEMSYALLLGVGAAAEYAIEVGMETARDRSWALAERARGRLETLAGTRVLDRGTVRCAIATAAFDRHDGADLKLRLRELGINTSSPGREDAVIDMDAKRAGSALRISPHYYNTDEEVDRAVDAIGELIGAAARAPATHSRQ